MRTSMWVGWLVTLALAVPFALLAVAGAAWLTENLSEIAAIGSHWDWGAAMKEASERLPEGFGILVGQALMLAILFLVRRDLAEAG